MLATAPSPTHHECTYLRDNRIRNPTATTSTSPLVIETQGLTRQYGHITAVDDLSLRVRKGEVYGFLGPNGAGKTTTLRMLLGLIQPTSGTISVLGSGPGTSEGLARVGSMIETPAFYPFLSGRDNLAMLAAYTGTPTGRIDEVLGMVRLADRAGDSFRTYSLGMKQRLGVAAALLKDPPLLILDEPTNGLDPAGMAEMRQLIRELGTGERTVLLSSHLMHEVEHICDRVGVIARGQLVAEGTVDALRGSVALVIRADPLQEAKRLVEGFARVTSIEIEDDALRIGVDPRSDLDTAYVNHRLVAAGIAVCELRLDQRSLESVFLSLTSSDAPAGLTTVD
ncbi:MAG: ABC transporter ATP-binding protein [Chloroflexota bacterium]|nr:ABC transporter ATP-binding protein [Chloroflexota bacterium]